MHKVASNALLIIALLAGLQSCKSPGGFWGSSAAVITLYPAAVIASPVLIPYYAANKARINSKFGPTLRRKIIELASRSPHKDASVAFEEGKIGYLYSNSDGKPLSRPFGEAITSPDFVQANKLAVETSVYLNELQQLLVLTNDFESTEDINLADDYDCFRIASWNYELEFNKRLAELTGDFVHNGYGLTTRKQCEERIEELLQSTAILSGTEIQGS